MVKLHLFIMGKTVLDMCCSHKMLSLSYLIMVTDLSNNDLICHSLSYSF